MSVDVCVHHIFKPFKNLYVIAVFEPDHENHNYIKGDRGWQILQFGILFQRLESICQTLALRGSNRIPKRIVLLLTRDLPGNALILKRKYNT